MPEQFGDKKHDATPHRRQQAREEGQVARSQDLASAMVLIGGLLALMYFGDGLTGFLGEYMQRQFSDAWLRTSRDQLLFQSYVVADGLTRCLLPLLGFFMLAAVAAHLGQVGFLFVPKSVGMDPQRINPLANAGRVFSWSSVVRLLLGMGKVSVVAAVAVWSLWSEQEAIASLSGRSLPAIGLYIVHTSLWTCLKIGTALLILALLDYLYQRWKYDQDLRMTDQELREEMKSLQGDPQIIARRRAIQRQLVLNRVGTTVPKADVVVTNPTELAIAIQYDIDTMAAPIVVAKGAGVLAQRIRRLALENNVPVVERKELARVLYKEVDIGKSIPAAQYAAVAEILRYVYQLKGKPLPNLRAL